MFLMFDLDGTLLDPRADLCNAVNFMQGEYGLEPLSLGSSQFVGSSVRKLAERSLRGTALTWMKRFLFCRRYLDIFMTRQPFIRVLKTASMLKNAGFKLALISNKPGVPCVA